MSFNPQELKTGVVFRYNNQIYISCGSRQKVSGRQRSVVVVKSQNLDTDQVVELRLRGSEAVEIINAMKKSASFLYSDQNYAYFIEPDNYQQHSLSLKSLESKASYLSPGQKVILVFIEDNLKMIELPKTVCLAVTQAEPAAKGDTVKNPTKVVKVETGLEVKVPMFIKVGDKIVIDVSSDKYQKREDAT